MKDDLLWIDVTTLMRDGLAGLGEYISWISQHPDLESNQGECIGRLNSILAIRDIELHVEQVTGADKSVEVVVDIFNRVNSGGTKLSHGDLALAKICGSWPEGREHMQSVLGRWAESGYHFSLDWLWRNMNAIVAGEARFVYLHDTPTNSIKDGLARGEKENYLQFLEERQRLLAKAANDLIEQLLHGASLAAPSDSAEIAESVAATVPGGIEDAEEEAILNAINQWLSEQGLPAGIIEHELSHPESGDPVAILDLAWPNGIQEGFSDPVAPLLDEGPRTLQAANDHGFRHFTAASLADGDEGRVATKTDRNRSPPSPVRTATQLNGSTLRSPRRQCG